MKFKKQVAIEVTVGIFTMAAIAALLALTTLLSEELLFKQYTRIEVRFDRVNGLRPGDEVNARGVAVGKVKRVFLAPDGVHVQARLDMPVDLRADYQIMVVASSVLGGNMLSITEGSPEAAAVPLTGLLQGSSAAGLMDAATKTVEDIQAALNAGILEDLKASMAQIRKITTSLGEGQGALGSLLGDAAVQGDVRQIVANIRRLTDTLAQGEGTVGRLLSEDDQVYQDLAATIAQIRSIAEAIGRGEGSAGRLLADDAMYEEFQGLLREGRAAVDDIRETSPITTFTDILFGIF